MSQGQREDNLIVPGLPAWASTSFCLHLGGIVKVSGHLQQSTRNIRFVLKFMTRFSGLSRIFTTIHLIFTFCDAVKKEISLF